MKVKYDYIIVGAGSAGSVLATRLSENPDVSVLLLEAGPDYADFDTMPESIKNGNNPWRSAYAPDAHSWNYTATATPGRDDLIIPRGKVVGGSSSINGQIFFRGIPEDYEEWAEKGNDEWAFTKILPYFRKSETDRDFGGDDFHGSEGPIPVRRFKTDDMLPAVKAFMAAAGASGFHETLDHNHPESEGYGARPLNNIDGIRMSTNLTYLNVSRHRINLTIRGNVLANRVLFEGTKAIGVEVESDGEVFQVYGNEIIVSGGAINSPQLLMLSGVGPRDHLACLGIESIVDLPGVGENLRDHPAVMVLFKIDPIENEEIIVPMQAGMRYTTPNSKYKNDMQMSPLLRNSEHRPPHIQLEEGTTYMGYNVAIQKAEAAGQIRLNSADPKQQPRIDYRYLSHPWDLERLREAVRLCVDITSRPEYQGLLHERLMPTDVDLSNDDTLDAWLMANVGTQHHSSGTCKMGPASDSMAVVDQYGSVRGTQGLRVVDASIMPDVVRANTNATVIMMAERVADMIAEGK